MSATVEAVESAESAIRPAAAALGSPFWRGDPLRRRLLALADAGAAAAFAGVCVATQHLGPRSTFQMTAALLLWLPLAKLGGLYDRDHRTLRHLTADELPALLLWVIAAGGLTGIVALGNDGSVVSRAMLLALAVAVVAAIFLRATARAAWRRIVPRDRVAILGEPPVADATRRKFELFADMHADVVAELPLDEARESLRGIHSPVLERVDRIVVATSAPGEPVLPELLRYCRARNIRLSMVAPAHDRVASIVHVTQLGELATLEYNTWDASRSTLLLKRGLDVVASAVALVLFLPVFALVAAAIYADDRGPVLFRQRRAGRHGRPFTLWKFRTMIVGAEQQLSRFVTLDDLAEPMFKLRPDPRVTRIGRLLRRLSVDELPQLVNVLRGEMSLVGPRPEQVEIVERYEPEHRFRLDAKPGLTGPMQIYGRAELTFAERLAVERDYIDNLSVGRDLRILMLTLAPLFLRSGAC